MILFKEMLMEAQFHGSNRLAERKYRYCWAVGLILFFWASSCIIIVTISRFMDTPTYLAITESGDIILNFPSVVVCPEIAFPEYKIDAFLAAIEYPPAINASLLKSKLHQLAAFYSPDMKYSLNDLKLIEYVLDYNLLEVDAASRRLTPSCSETILRCRWLGQYTNCLSLFQMELTRSGFCCVFNGRSIRREMAEYGIHKIKKPPTITVTQTGPDSGIMLAVNSSQKQSDLDLTYKWVYVVTGRRYVESSVNGTPISPNTEFWVGFKSRRFIIGDDVLYLSSKLRRCRLTTDPLKYHPYYNKRSCLLECEMARTLKRCHCVHIIHPRPHNVPVCRARSLLCAHNSAVTYDTDLCDCPATCNNVLDTFVTQTYPLTPGNYVSDNFYEGLDYSKVCIVRAFIPHHDKKVFARRPYFSSVHLFSQIGGVFNLFFGCSILTLFELVQLAWYGYQEIKAKRPLNKPPKLILPPPASKKSKKRKKNKMCFK